VIIYIPSDSRVHVLDGMDQLKVSVLSTHRNCVAHITCDGMTETHTATAHIHTACLCIHTGMSTKSKVTTQEATHIATSDSVNGIYNPTHDSETQAKEPQLNHSTFPGWGRRGSIINHTNSFTMTKNKFTSTHDSETQAKEPQLNHSTFPGWGRRGSIINHTNSFTMTKNKFTSTHDSETRAEVPELNQSPVPGRDRRDSIINSTNSFTMPKDKFDATPEPRIALDVASRESLQKGHRTPTRTPSPRRPKSLSPVRRSALNARQLTRDQSPVPGQQAEHDQDSKRDSRSLTLKRLSQQTGYTESRKEHNSKMQSSVYSDLNGWPTEYADGNDAEGNADMIYGHVYCVDL